MEDAPAQQCILQSPGALTPNLKTSVSYHAPYAGEPKDEARTIKQSELNVLKLPIHSLQDQETETRWGWSEKKSSRG
jgi:hypothetical protein